MGKIGMSLVLKWDNLWPDGRKIATEKAENSRLKKTKVPEPTEAEVEMQREYIEDAVQDLGKKMRLKHQESGFRKAEIVQWYDNYVMVEFPELQPKTRSQLKELTRKILMLELVDRANMYENRVDLDLFELAKGQEALTSIQSAKGFPKELEVSPKMAAKFEESKKRREAIEEKQKMYEEERIVLQKQLADAYETEKELTRQKKELLEQAKKDLSNKKEDIANM